MQWQSRRIASWYNVRAMALPNVEKLHTSLVVLSGMEGEINLSSEALASVIRDPITRSLGEPPTAVVEIASIKDQVVIRLEAGKFIFRDESDDWPRISRLPEVVYRFLDMLQKQEQGITEFRAYGFNFDVAFDVRGDETAAEVIADRYVNKEALSEKGNIRLQGAALRLFFDYATGAKCDLRIEPRGNKLDSPRFFAHINYHYELQDRQMPPLETVKTAYLGLWPTFTELLEKLLVK